MSEKLPNDQESNSEARRRAVFGPDTTPIAAALVSGGPKKETHQEAVDRLTKAFDGQKSNTPTPEDAVAIGTVREKLHEQPVQVPVYENGEIEKKEEIKIPKDISISTESGRETAVPEKKGFWDKISSLFIRKNKTPIIPTSSQSVPKPVAVKPLSVAETIPAGMNVEHTPVRLTETKSQLPQEISTIQKSDVFVGVPKGVEPQNVNIDNNPIAITGSPKGVEPEKKVEPKKIHIEDKTALFTDSQKKIIIEGNPVGFTQTEKINIDGTEKGWLRKEEDPKPKEEVKPQKINIEGAEKGWLRKEEEPKVKKTEPKTVPLRVVAAAKEAPSFQIGSKDLKKPLTTTAPTGINALDKKDTVKELNEYFDTNQKNSMMFSGREQLEQSLKAQQLLQHLKTFDVPPRGIKNFEEKVNRDAEDATAQVVMDIVNVEGDRNRTKELEALLAQERIGSYTGPNVKKYVEDVLRGVLEQRAQQKLPEDHKTTRFIKTFLTKHAK